MTPDSITERPELKVHSPGRHYQCASRLVSIIGMAIKAHSPAQSFAVYLLRKRVNRRSSRISYFCVARCLDTRRLQNP